MVGAVDGASGDGSPTSASALTSSSLPRSLSSGTDDGLEAGRSPNRSTPSSRMNSRDFLLGSQRWPGFRSRTGFGSAYFQVDDLGVYLSSVAVTVLMATVGVILLTLIVTLTVLLGKCPKQSLLLSEEFCLWVLLFKGRRMSAVAGKKKGLLEFGHWVLIFALHSLRSYVVYPPEGPRPRTGDEIRDMIKKTKAAS